MITVLVDVKDRLELPTTMPVHHRRTMHRDGETTFAIHESNDPIGIEHGTRTRSFLLIVRTGRIFTFHVTISTKRCDMNKYRRILGCPSI